MLLIVLTAFFSRCSGNGLVSYYLHDILRSVVIEGSYEQSLINGGLRILSFLVAIEPPAAGLAGQPRQNSIPAHEMTNKKRSDLDRVQAIIYPAAGRLVPILILL